MFACVTDGPREPERLFISGADSGQEERSWSSCACRVAAGAGDAFGKTAEMEALVDVKHGLGRGFMVASPDDNCPKRQISF